MRRQQLGEQKPVYGLRKLSMGFGSVLLGTMLYAGTSAPIHADVLPTGEQNAMNSNSLATNEQSNSNSSPAVNNAQPATNQPTVSAPAVNEAPATVNLQTQPVVKSNNAMPTNGAPVNNQSVPKMAPTVSQSVTNSNNETVGQVPVANPSLTINVPTTNMRPVQSSANKLPDFTMVIGSRRGQVGYQISTHPDKVLDNYSVEKTDNNGGYQVGVKPNGNYVGMLTIPNLADVQGRYADASRLSFNFASLKQANLNAVTGLSFSGTNSQKVMLAGSLRRVLANLRNLRSIDLMNTDTSQVTDLNNAFSNLPLLQTINLANADFSQVISADELFANDRALSLINGLTGLNFSKLQSANGMFENTPNLRKVDLSGVKTSGQLTSLQNMFNRSGVKQVNFDNVDLSGVTDLSGAFANTSDLTVVNGLRVDNVENLAHLYDGSGMSVVDMHGINGQYVRDLSYAFANMPNLTRIDNLKDFEFENQGRLKSIRNLVENDQKLTNLALDGFYNVNGLTDMQSAFKNTGLKVLDLSVINPVNVQSFAEMASDNPELSLVMLGSQFNVRSGADLSRAFANDPKLSSLDLASLNTAGNITANSMFAGDKNLKSLTSLDGIQANKDQLLAGLNQSLVQNIRQYDQSLVAAHHSQTWTRTVHLVINNGTASYTMDVPQSAHADWDGGDFPTGLKLPDLRLSDYAAQFEDKGIHLTPAELAIVIPGPVITASSPAVFPDITKTYGGGAPVSLSKQVQLIDDDWTAGMTDKNGQALNQIAKILSYTLPNQGAIVSANVDAQLPAGYEIVPGESYPSTITASSADVQKVHVRHKVDQSSASIREFIRTYQGVDDSNGGKQIFYRTVGLRVPVSGAGTDEVTGKTVGGNFPDGRYSFKAYDPANDTKPNSDGSVIADVMKNYQLASGASTIPAEPITSDSPNEKTYTIHYVLKNSSGSVTPSQPSTGDKQVVFTFVDDDWKAGMKDAAGHDLQQNPGSYSVNVPAHAYNVPTNVEQHIPAGYELANGIHYPTAIDGRQTAYTIHLQHHKSSTGKQKLIFTRTIHGVDQNSGQTIFTKDQSLIVDYDGLEDDVTGQLDPVAFPSNLQFSAYDPMSDPEVANALTSGKFRLVSGSAGVETINALTPQKQTVTLTYQSDDDTPVTPIQKNAIHLQFIDLDFNDEVAGARTLANLDTGSAVDLQQYFSQEYGDKYQLDTKQNKLDNGGDLLPYQVTADKDQIVKIYLRHKTDISSEGRTIHRRIYLAQADGTKKLLEDQTVDVSRSVTKDLVDGSTKKGDWTEADFPEYDVNSDLLTNDNGQTITQSQIPSDEVESDQINKLQEDHGIYHVDDVVLSYGDSEGNVTASIVFVTKDGEVIDDSGAQVTGKPGQKVDLTQQGFSVPDGYELDPGQSLTITLGNATGEVDIKVHAIVKDVTNDPDFQDQIDAVSLTGKRTIQFLSQDTSKQLRPDIVQMVHFVRRAYYNAGTDEITYSKWTLASDSTDPNHAQFDGMDIPMIAGYTPVAGQQIKPIVVTGVDDLPESEVTTTIYYQPDKDHQAITETINFKTADGSLVGSQIVTGTPGQSVAVDNVPSGYHLVNSADSQLKLTKDGQSVNILVAADDQPAEQDITGTVNYVDKTGKVIKSGLIKGTPDKEIDVTSQVSLPDGYHLANDASSTVQLTKDGQNIFNIIVQSISVTPGDQMLSGTVNYVTDAGNVVGTGTISGKPGETFDVTSQVKLPEGYRLVNDSDKNVALTSNKQVVIVKVKKNSGETEMQGTVFYIDRDTGDLVSTGVIKGMPGQKVDISDQVPDNYQLADSNNSQVTLVEGQSQYRIKVVQTSQLDPDSGVIYLQFKNGKENIGSSIELKGKIGDLIDWTKQASIPAGYELVNANDQLPVQIMRKMQIITIQLKHKQQANPVQTIQRKLIYDLYAGDSVQPFASITKEATGQVTTYKDLVTGQDIPTATIVWNGGDITASELPVPANYHLLTKLDGLDSVWLPTSSDDPQSLTSDAHIKVYFAMTDEPMSPEQVVTVGLKTSDQDSASAEIEQKLNDQIRSAFNGVLKPYNVSNAHPMSQLISQLKTALTLQAVQERLKDVVPSIDATDIQVKQTADNQIMLELAFKHHHTQSVEHMTANELIMFVDQAGNDLGHTISASLPLTVTTDRDEVTGQTKTSSLVAEDGSFKSYDVQDLVNKLFTGYQPIGLTANYGQVNGKFVISPIDNSDGMINSFVPDADHLNTIIQITLAKKATPDQPDVTKKVDKKIIFVDDQGNSIGQLVEISGKAGTSQDVVYQVPAGYYVANGAKGMTVHFDHDEVIKVLVKKVVQTASWSLSFVDATSGKVIGSAIVKGPMNSQQSLNGLVPAGYELVNNSDNNFVLNKLTNNWQVKVQKKVVPQVISRNIVYLAPDGKIIGRQAVSGETGSTQTVTLQVPKGYKYDQSTIDLKLDSTADYMLMVSADSKPTNPDQSDKPDGKPSQPVNPTNPTKPTNPDQSDNSANPNEKPDQPNKPTNPAKPTNPDTNSDQPVKPNDKPNQPADGNGNQTANSQAGSNQAEKTDTTSSGSSFASQNAEQPAIVNTVNNGDNGVVNVQSAGYQPAVNASEITNGGQAVAGGNGTVAADSVGASGVTQPVAGATNANNAGSLPQTGQQDASALAALGAFTAMFGLGLLKKKRED